MKFACEAKPFKAALAAAGKIIPAKAPWPIVTHVKIATNDNRIIMTGSDMDTTMEQELPAEVHIEGVLCIPYATLAAFVAAAKAGDMITVEGTDNGSATVKSGRSRITFSTPRADDFPSMRPTEGAEVTVDASTFRQAISFCVAAASTEEAKYYLNGAYVSERDGLVEVWGTDGHAMHRAILPGVSGIGGGGILPTLAVGLIAGIIDKADTASVMISDRGWHARAKGVRAWGKVIDGTYPDAARAIAQFREWDEVALATKADLTAAITVATCGNEAMAGKSSGLVVIGKEGEPVVVKGARGASGILHPGRAEMEALARSTATGCIASKLISAAVGAMGAEDLVLSIASGGAAMRIEPAQQNAAMTLSALIMGMRAKEEEMADAA